MKVYISVDMEGIGGVSDPHPTDPADRRYPVSVDLMVGETNAAISGALYALSTRSRRNAETLMPWRNSFAISLQGASVIASPTNTSLRLVT